jgi:uncharacterized protein (TIGR02145 family)
MKSPTSILFFGILVLITFSCKKEEKPPDPVTDIEGNRYNTVRIGTQIWMAENLKTTMYNDGTEIPLVANSSDWKSLTTPGYCWYNNDMASNKDVYGALYNGFTVTTGKLCPTSWHVPTWEEWQQLSEFSGDTITGGGKLKETGTTHWLAPNKGATNSTGFNALPSGIRYFEGSFTAILHFTGFWSSTDVGTDDESFLSLYFGDASAIMNHTSRNNGLSVRCIRD